jgi:phage gp29-like protein
LAANPDLWTHQAVDIITEGLFALVDPDEILRKAGLTRAELRRLEADDEISAALETRQSAVVSLPLKVEPYDATIAPFIEEQLAPLTECIARGAWSAVPYGYSVIEHVYRRIPNGRIGLADAAEKPFEWFTPKQSGRLMYGANGFGLAEVDTGLKFNLTTRQATWRNPYGEALLSRAYWPYFMRSAGWRFWSRFLERLGGPLLVGKTAGSAQTMADALLASVQSGALAVHSQDSVEAIQGGTDGQSFRMYSERVDGRIQKLILGQTLTTEAGSRGSYSLGKVHDGVRRDRRDADIRLVNGALQRTANAIAALNFPGQPVPRVFLDEGRELNTERAERDSKLVQAGVVRLTKKYLLDKYDFEPGDIEVAAPSPAGTPQPPAPTGPDEPPSSDDDGGEFTARARAYFAAVAARDEDTLPDDELVLQLAAELDNRR